MRKTDSEIEKKLIWKAAKYNLPTSFSFYFKNLSVELRKDMSSQIDVAISGEPVLLFTRPIKEWTVICTRQVIGFDGHRLEKLNLADMRQMLPHGIPPLQHQPKGARLEINKAEWNQLTIIDCNNTPYTFCAQAGPDFFALWNILLMARRMVYG
jgi:hypothetical protein